MLLGSMVLRLVSALHKTRSLTRLPEWTLWRWGDLVVGHVSAEADMDQVATGFSLGPLVVLAARARVPFGRRSCLATGSLASAKASALVRALDR